MEQDYVYNDINSHLNNLNQKTKELKAHKAELLSVKSLREIADRNNLKEPDHNHIIIIP
ncbi:MAG: hypothetical protein JNM93_10050 [Bacteriovoracaceae bacterium]|nr:hypothetical protein [Bacteriovoracaceae bacterium]